MNSNNTYMNKSYDFFYWGKDPVILFDGWPGYNQLGMYIVALLVVFLVAIVAEMLTFTDMSIIKLRSLIGGPVSVGALVHALVYGVRKGLFYLVMLSVMSYNVGVLIAALAGHVVGSFIAKYRALSA